MKLYLDACALNRLFDDLTQSRVEAEARAMEDIMTSIATGQHVWISSSALIFEVSRNSNVNRREKAFAALRLCASNQIITSAAELRARALVALGFKPLDALHLALAELGGADLFLTTDDRLLSRATALAGELRVTVLNPRTWSRKQ